MTDISSVSDLIRMLFSAFLSQDRKTLEDLLSDDFTFNSPRDEHINKAAFFEQCFPGSDQFRSHHIEQLFVQGNEALVRYRAELKDGTAFRNTEYIRVEGNKIKETDVYFGAPLTRKEASS
ncbi:MAG: nuclear transport factor 2 family protein [Ktedonobacteraceae bacterium]|nr:nuclear transport factor 2 family protein [Ktedonobacteraceae bacterium]